MTQRCRAVWQQTPCGFSAGARGCGCGHRRFPADYIFEAYQMMVVPDRFPVARMN